MSATTFTQELADSICQGLASGRSLQKLCKELGTHTGCVMRWLADSRHEEFRRQYTHARELQADYLAEEILDIADDYYGDPDANSRRLRVDARKWYAGKLRPKKYGEASQIDINLGSQPGNPLTLEVRLSPEEAYKRMLGGASDQREGYLDLDPPQPVRPVLQN
jgi:hypothetical protein